MHYLALDAKQARLNVCDLETIGRVTGRPHVVEIWFAADPTRDRVYMMAGDRDRADWVRNVRHDGRVRIKLGRTWLSGYATEIEGSSDEAPCRQLLAAKYYGWRDGQPLGSWARDSLPVAIDLET